MNTKQIVVIAAVAVVVVASLSALFVMSNDNKGDGLKDAAGNEIVIPAELKTITAASPSIADLVCYMNLGEKIVCTSTYCDNPLIPAGVTTCGSYTNPDSDGIATVNATVTLIDGSNSKTKSVYDTLRKSGMNVILMYGSDDSIDGIYKNIEIIGKLSNDTSKADTIVNELKNTISALRESIRSASSTNIIVATGFGKLATDESGKFTNLDNDTGSGVYLAGDASLIYSLSKEVTVSNIELSGGWVKVDSDYISTSTGDSDVLLILWTNKKSMPTEDSRQEFINSLKSGDNAWANCGAIQKGNVFFIGGDVGTDLSRATPYTVENGLPILSLLVNPECFSSTPGGSALTWENLPGSIDESNESILIEYTKNIVG